ncbi:MAG: ATP-binding protein [Anaerobacillus sp.]
MKQYQGRIISVFTFLTAILIWDYWLYSVNDIPVDWVMDSLFTITVLFIVWWYSSYYDRSKLLLSKLKESEERHRQLSENYGAVIDNLNEVVFQTGKSGSWLWLNNAWERLTGFDVGESIGTYFLSYFHPDDRHNFHEHMNNLLNHHVESTVFEYRIQRKGGGYSWCDVFIKFEYDKTGNYTGTTGTIKDQTQRKQTEERLVRTNEDLAIRSEKLAAAAQLAAGIAHEVRNPLTSIKGFLQLLEKKESIDSYYEIIFSEISRIELVLSELLTLAKPQNTLFDKVKLNELLKQVTTLIESNAILNDIELKMDLPEVDVYVFADANQIKQVLINLMKNAIEAIDGLDRSGVISLSMSVLSDSVSLYIEDNGFGIPKDYLKRLGEPFFTTKEAGTGLGLSVCLTILEQHGGEMIIKSEVSVGSTFILKLPLIKGA